MIETAYKPIWRRTSAMLRTTGRGQISGPGNLFKPVRISDNWCWHNAFTQFNICHRIDAKDLANLRHDAGLLTIQVEHLAATLVLTDIPRPIPRTAPLN
jgi:hypothetical protein